MQNKSVRFYQHVCFNNFYICFISISKQTHINMFVISLYMVRSFPSSEVKPRWRNAN